MKQIVSLEKKALVSFHTWRVQVILLMLCVGTRALTSLHYIADPDSLRFALAARDFDLANLQPHFPGYPVFCFLLQVLTALTGKFSLAFSLIGGLSTFAIIHYLVKLVRWAGWNIHPWLIAGSVFFNPMLWIMGNRYMPDLAGLALTVAGCALFIKAKESDKAALGLMFITGLLAGTRLSYLPVLLLPVLWSLFKGREPVKQVIAGLSGVLVWLVPMIIDTGWNDLIAVATTHTHGHFNDWGGTIETESSYGTRAIVFMQSIVADGLGGYWPGRNISTLAVSVLLFAGIIAAVIKLRVEKAFSGARNKLLLASILLYSLWAYLFQNIIYNPRHIMPLIPALLLIAAAGYTAAEHRSRLLIAAGIAFIAMYAAVTFALVRQHIQPGAIARVSEDMRSTCDSSTVIVSTELINYYLSGTGVKCDKIDIASTMDDLSEALNKYDRVITIGNFELNYLGTPASRQTYYHNPYVNRIWAEISVKEYVVK